jgi:hypothetical protein
MVYTCKSEIHRCEGSMKKKLLSISSCPLRAKPEESWRRELQNTKGLGKTEAFFIDKIKIRV